ncbi:Spo0E-like regulatory phosphatase [Paenibacillus sp. 32O-W]|jgi:Spo0E like sporulation regulatory protein.|uniref:Aspartyl-phosphate phosphatase Spo0E family protein n=2 Tax=Paenibacillus cisolokensis TaxID=1658519 RepID=A0ABQ4NDF5_9BACL|nr:Spo0E-like regulatory phosphatase [Paenibacillus sp. 32O-W]GIQ66215.1 hypothetical protein PACILC2_47830 [Paenibacillus cisolokensis]
MAVADYGFNVKNVMDFWEEPDPYKAMKLSPYMRILEDEIYVLRKQMELTCQQEASFHSELVIEISRKLDVKINEYMRCRMKMSRLKA